MAKKTATPLRPVLLTVTEGRPDVLFLSLRLLMKEGLAAPEALKLLTTREGREAFLDLIRPLENHELKLGENTVPLDDVVELFTNPGGDPVDNVAADDGLQSAGDSLIAAVTDLTKDAQTALCLTMPATSPLVAFAEAAMARLARPQDHLLLITAHGDEPLPSFDARWLDFTQKLAEDDRFEAVLLQTALLRDKFRLSAPTNAERKTSKRITEHRHCDLIFDLPESEIITRTGIHVHLEPSLLAFYWWLVNRVVNQRPGPNPGEPQAAREFLEVREYVLRNTLKHRGRNTRHARSAQVILADTDAFRKFFTEKKAFINRALEDSLSPYEFRQLKIVSIGRRPWQKYTVLFGKGRKAQEGIPDVVTRQKCWSAGHFPDPASSPAVPQEAPADKTAS